MRALTRINPYSRLGKQRCHNSGFRDLHDTCFRARSVAFSARFTPRGPHGWRAPGRPACRACATA
jgi:hypothetical protein